jgi:sugar lactone lactonase YvrE
MNTLKRTSVALLTLTLVMFLGCMTFPKTIPLPKGFQPEGIAIGNGPTAYVSSLAGGSIYAADLTTGNGAILVQGTPATPFAVGLDFDRRSGYLFVAGGLTGDMRVYDTGTAQMVDQLLLSVPFNSWINDVFVTPRTAYFTNSFAPEIYKVPLTSQGAPTGDIYALPLHGDWQQFTNPAPMGFEDMWINANGIVATPDERTLIVVNYYSGLLYKVDSETGHATEIALGGNTVPTGDGLVLKGNTLYVAQNFANAIAVFRLSPDYSAAAYIEHLADSDLHVPSTADLFGPWLYAVNARFDECFPGPCPDTDYDIVRVDR